VLIDICPPHGTWFDADELHRIMEFIDSGGLQRAAKKEKDALAAEVEALKKHQTQSRMVFSDKVGMDYDPDDSFGRVLTRGNGAVAIAGWIFKKIIGG
jgi:Zn-finger nucleic acid-binding protein